MSLPSVLDVVTGGATPLFPGGAPRRTKKRGPKRQARILRRAITTGSGGGLIRAAARYLPWIGVGYGAFEIAKWVRDPNFDPWGTVRANMRDVARREAEINAKVRAIRLKQEKEKAARAAYEEGELAAQEEIAYRTGAPGAPPAAYLPGSPEYSRETQRLVEQKRRAAVLAAGGTVPPRPYADREADARAAGASRAAATAGPAAAAAAQKKTMRERAAALLANPLFTLGLLAASTISLPKFGGKKSAPPAEEFFDEPLTSFEPEGVTFGELGGDFAFEPDPQTESMGDECETIDPRRTPGECRQGWFSETPKALYLKEWSRRPCP